VVHDEVQGGPLRRGIRDFLGRNPWLHPVNQNSREGWKNGGENWWNLGKTTGYVENIHIRNIYIYIYYIYMGRIWKFVVIKMANDWDPLLFLLAELWRLKLNHCNYGP
jgi:hypothetical protein